MRMCRRLALDAGGNKKVTVTVLGAPGETVAYSGRTAGTVTLSAAGAAVLAGMKAGTYSFTGGISGYIRSGLRITADRTVNVYPDGIVYWYGRFASGADAVGVNLGSGAAITKNANSLGASGASGYYMTVYFTPALALPGKTLKIRLASSWGSDSYRRFGLRSTTAAPSNADTGYAANTVPAPSGDTALAVGSGLTGSYYPTWSCYNGGCAVSAVWYE